MDLLFNDSDADTDEAYRECRRSRNGTREFLEDAWARFGHLVGDRPQHFLTEFRSRFHDRSWELWLLAALADAGLTLEPGKPKGPDVCAALDGRRVWIEAVVASPGAPNSPDRVPSRRNGGASSASYDERLALLRYRSALEDKLGKIDEYVRDGLIGRDEPVLIALNHGQLEDSDLLDTEVPAVVRAVYPIGEAVAVVTPYSDEPVQLELPPRFTVAKAKMPEQEEPSEVSTTFFFEPRSAAVSGVLFASQPVRSLSRSTKGALGLVHNSQAAAPFPRGGLPVRSEHWVENGELRQVGSWSPWE